MQIDSFSISAMLYRVSDVFYVVSPLLTVDKFNHIT